MEIAMGLRVGMGTKSEGKKVFQYIETSRSLLPIIYCNALVRCAI